MRINNLLSPDNALKSACWTVALLLGILFMTPVNVSATNGNQQNMIDGHTYVDLGLPSGTLWAEYNVGGYQEMDFGTYVAWGETSQKSQKLYSFVNYKYARCFRFEASLSEKVLAPGTYETRITKYCTNSESGRVDNKLELEGVDDVATAAWGENWCTPTQEQMNELIKSCKWQRVENEKGQIYYVITGPNNNHIIMPECGKVAIFPGDYSPMFYKLGKNDSRVGFYYWSKTISNKSSKRAITLQANENGRYYISNADRSDGLPVRAVVNR